MTDLHRARRFAPLLAALLLAGAVGSACVEQANPVCLVPRALPDGPFATERIAAALADEGVRVRGFTGAAPPSSKIVISLNSKTIEVESDALGRFEGVLVTKGASSDEALLTIAGDSTSVRVRPVSGMEGCVARPPLVTGTTPNDLAVALCGGIPVAFTPNSADGALAPTPLLPTNAGAPVLFPADDEGRGANPYHVTLDTSGARAAVSLFGQDAVTLVDPCQGRVLDVAEPSASDGGPLVIDVTPAMDVEVPLDADGDGESETHIERMRLRAPQGVAFAGDRLLVSYTNVLQLGEHPRYGPGVVVAFDVMGDELHPAGHVVLPFDNPQGLTLDEQGRPWVSCSGPLGPGQTAFEALSDGGLVRLAPDTLELERVIPFGRFAPGTPAFDGDFLVVGSLVQPQVAVLPVAAGSVEQGQILPLPGGLRTESAFEAAALGGGLFLVTDFSSDVVHVIDALASEVDPWPFEGGIGVGPGGLAFRGAQAVTRVPGFTFGEDAPDAVALLGLSSEIVPLQIWQVLGP